MQIYTFFLLVANFLADFLRDPSISDSTHQSTWMPDSY